MPWTESEIDWTKVEFSPIDMSADRIRVRWDLPDIGLDDESHRALHRGVDLHVWREDGWQWIAVEYTATVVGPYPGSPDWDERVIGDGVAPTETEAKWRAIRAVERDRILQDVLDVAEEEWIAEYERDQAEYEASLDEMGVGEGLIDGPGSE